MSEAHLEENKLLQNAFELGIIDLESVKQQIEMKKRKELLDSHPYSIWNGKNGKWYTYLPDNTKERGKSLVKRNTQKDIEDLIVQYWEKQSDAKKVYSFEDAYFLWRETQDQLVSEKSIAKYNSDYKRFFEDSPFSTKDITKITDDEVRIFMKNTIEKYALNSESSRKLFGYIRNTFFHAWKNGIVSENKIEFLRAKDFYRYCTEKHKLIDNIIVPSDDMIALQKQFEEDHINKPNYIPTYAVEFATLTGMRVGEIAGLSWDKITDKYIVIDQSEKSDSSESRFWISRTKNGKERIFPMTDEVRKLLDTIKKVEEEYGYLCEWVFANENGRIHKNVISSCSKNKCRQANIRQRGIHAYRKTLNSRMRCNGVSSTVAASILGHSKEVNERYYTFDVTDIKEKSRIISEVNALTVKGNTR